PPPRHRPPLLAGLRGGRTAVVLDPPPSGAIGATAEARKGVAKPTRGHQRAHRGRHADLARVEHSPNPRAVEAANRHDSLFPLRHRTAAARPDSRCDHDVVREAAHTRGELERCGNQATAVGRYERTLLFKLA